jgi:biopolymer transport protein ExbD
MAIRLDHGSDELLEVHDINVTPFIDVMLVLLIIFMVAAPLATVDVPVDLPAANVAQQKRPDKPVYLSIKSDLTLAIGDDSVAPGALGTALDAATGANKEARIFLRADRAVHYGDVMQVMNELRGDGYLKIALVALETRDAK